MVIYQNIIHTDNLKKSAVNMLKILAATMLASTLGVEFDPEKDWSEREDIYKMSGKIVRLLMLLNQQKVIKTDFGQQ